MKKIYLLSLLGGLTLGSCSNNKDLYDETTTTTTARLSVPSTFTWETMQQVTLNITSPVTSKVSVYSDANCTDLLANVPVTKDVTQTITVSVPNTQAILYVKYPTSATATNVSKVSLGSSKAASRATEVYDVNYKNGLAGIYELSFAEDADKLLEWGSKGTAMFEDLWPALGDYDLNDVVVDYNIVGHISQSSKNAINPGYERIDVTLSVRAIGGLLPKTIGLTFANNTSVLNTSLLKQSDIDSYKNLNVNQDGLTVTLANPNQAEATPIFYISNLRNVATSGYYNTKQNDGTKKTVNFTLYIKSTYQNLERDSRARSCFNAAYQDIFIVTTGGKEVHLRGFNPTSLYTSYATDAKANANLSATIPYCTNDNHVWGVKIPQGYAYAKETIDVKDAFTNFASWITSGGKTNTDWYAAPVSGKTFNY